MQENRSFDHYFGTLRGVRGFGDPHPVTLPSGKPVWHQPDGTGTEVLPFRPDVGRPRPDSSSRTSTTAGTAATRRSTAASTTSGCRPRRPTTMAHFDARGHPVPLRAGRRLHGLRRLPLLAARPDRPEPLLHVDRLGRQRRQGRRPGHRQRRDSATAGRPTPSACRRPASPGRSTRTSATASTPPASGAGPTTPTSATTATTRCCTSTSTRTPRPAARSTSSARTGTNVKAGGRASSTCCAPTCKSGNAAAGLLDRRARGLHRAPELAGQLRRLVRRAGARRADRRTRRCGARPRCSSPTTRTTASSTTWSRRTRRRRPAARRAPPSTRSTRVLRRPGRRLRRRPAPTASGCACRCSWSRRGARAAGSARRSSTTPR